MKIIKQPVDIIDINSHGCKAGGTGGDDCQGKYAN